jgi:transposase
MLSWAAELERLSKEELIELVLRLQRPQKTSRTSSKPPSTDRKQQRERSKPGGAKPGHDGHSRMRWSSTVLTGARAAQPS